MTVFNVIEKQQKSRFCLQFFLLKSLLQTQKSTFTAKFSPSPSLEVILFARIRCWGRATASHSSAMPRFSTSPLHCMLGNNQNFRQRLFLPPHISYLY